MATKRISHFLIASFGLLFLSAVPVFGDEGRSQITDQDVSPYAAVHIDGAGAETMLPASYAAGPAQADCRADCGKACCSCEKQAALQKAVAGSHKNMFYDNKFDYLCDPCYCGWALGDNLKRLRVTPWATLDAGGQYRMRLHNERNIRNVAPIGLGLTGADDDFLLHRTRVYLNAELGSRFRFYGEMLDAVSNYEDHYPRPIEENRTELQNLFGDFVLMDACRGSLTARIGRQELQFGSQRLVSPLDWANTRRTFDAAKLYWRGQNWDIDGFWSRPLVRLNPVNLTRLDPPRQNVEMYGAFSTYKGLSNGTVDLYWLALDNHARGFLYDTLGARYAGGHDNWLYEVEGAVQFGDNADGSDHSAGAVTAGIGRKFPCATWKPTLWLYYDWASGDDSQRKGPQEGNGFHHYYPLAHKYLGFMDLYGRRNLQDLNLRLTMQPHEKIKLLAWYHYFQLANINDVPYNVNMQAFDGMPSGSAGSRDLGSEIDLTATWLISPRSQLTLGYCHFFAGDFYGTSPVPYDGDADFVFTEFSVNF